MRGTGDLGIVVERAVGRVQVIDSSLRTNLASIPELGDLSHASAVFSRDARYAYVFGRDGGLSKVDLLAGRLEHRIVQAGNSIGGAISQDGKLIAVSNYEPGGVRVFDAGTLEPVADIPTGSKVVGLVDAPDQRFVFSLYDLGEIWLVDMSDPAAPEITKYPKVGQNPYDALITPDGRYYVAGLFGEDGLALLDLWHPDKGVRRILDGYGRGEEPLPVYKMPHLEGVALAGTVRLPAGGRAARDPGRGHGAGLARGRPDPGPWTAGIRRIPAGWPADLGQLRPSRQRHGPGDRRGRPESGAQHPTRPGGASPGIHAARRAGLDFGARCRPGRCLRHAQFRALLGSLPADKPSGIFMTARANRIGY